MTDRRYMLIFLGLGAAAVVVVVAAFLFGSPDAERTPLPPVLEEISPLPGAQVPLQSPVEVDVPVGYQVVMFVDGFRIPDSEVRFVEGTGVHSWAPNRSSTVAWSPGRHIVSVRWRKTSGLPDEGEHTWSFRVF